MSGTFDKNAVTDQDDSDIGVEWDHILVQVLIASQSLAVLKRMDNN